VARIRSIKPEFFRSVSIAKLGFGARLTFEGLWCYADDEGRYRYEPALLKADVWPVDDDVSAKQCGAWVNELEAAGRVCCYTIEGKRYLHIVNWDEHQKIDRRTKPKWPSCPKDSHGAPTPPPSVDEGSTNARDDSGDPSLSGSGSRRTERERDSATRVAPRRALDLVDPAAETAQTVLGAYIDWRRAQGVNGIDRRTTGLLAKQLGQAFQAGHPPDVIKRGLLAWHERDQHPSTLASFIDVEARGGQARASPGKAQRQLDDIQRTYQQMQAMNPEGGERNGDLATVDRDRRQTQRELP